MKIGFKLWVMNLNLVFGLGCLLWFFVESFKNIQQHSTDFSSLVLAIIFFNIYFYQRQNGYLKLDGGYLIKNRPFGKIINLSEVILIEFKNGIYTLKTADDCFTIHSTVIDKTTLENLKKELNYLNISWE